MPSPYATDEDAATLWFEQSIHASTHIAAMGYGIHLVVFFAATYYILKRHVISWRWGGWLLFNSTLLVLATINIACSIHFNEEAWIDERNYPGGPFALLTQQQARPVNTVANSAAIIVSFMADALLLHRVMLLWDYLWYIIIPPILFFVACTAVSIVTIIQIALPDSRTWASMPSFSLSYWLISLVLNLVLSLMLLMRLLHMRRRIQKIVGAEHGKTYTGIASLVTESALPFAILSVILMVLFAKGSTAQNLFVPLLVQVECIAPELIILRVVLGQAWSNDTLSKAMTRPLEFAPDRRSQDTDQGSIHTVSRTNGISVITFGDRSDSDLPKEPKEASASTVIPDVV